MYQETHFLLTALQTEPEKTRALVFIGCDRRPMALCPLCVFYICFWQLIKPANAVKKKINPAISPPVRLVFINKTGEPLAAGCRQRHRATGSKFMMLLFITRKMSIRKGGGGAEGTWFNPIFASAIWSNTYIYIYIKNTPNHFPVDRGLLADFKWGVKTYTASPV